VEGDIMSGYRRNNSSIPALGLAWSHCINTRFVVSKSRKNYVVSLGSEEEEEVESTYSEDFRHNEKNSEPLLSSSIDSAVYDNKENEENLYLSKSTGKKKLSEVFKSPPLHELSSTTPVEIKGNGNTVVRKQKRLLTLDFSSVECSKSASFHIDASGLL
jgi:hypothetical protein